MKRKESLDQDFKKHKKTQKTKQKKSQMFAFLFVAVTVLFQLFSTSKKDEYSSVCVQFCYRPEYRISLLTREPSYS